MELQLAITLFDGKRKKGHAVYMARKAMLEGQERNKAVRFMLSEAAEVFREKPNHTHFQDVEA